MAHERQLPGEDRAPTFEEQLVAELIQPATESKREPWSVPKTAAELHERVCKAADSVGVDVETLYRDTAGQPLDLARWLRFVETKDTRLAAFGKFAQRNYDPAKDTYRCARCLDKGYVRGAERGRYATMRFCNCEIARAAEAGWWFEYLYPMDKQARRALDNSRKPHLDVYCRKQARTKSDLQERIERVKDEYDKRRKRAKLDSLDEETD